MGVNLSEKLSVYKGKRVLVTGHTGFKGSWLSVWLRELGAEVTGYALDPYTDQDNFVKTGLADKMTDNRGDLRDLESLQQVFDACRPEIVFHMAAQPLVLESYRDPKTTIDSNVGGTVNVLECCRASETVKVIINITSDKCYENKEQLWGYKENDPMGGFDPYSASKGMVELLANSYRNSFFNPSKYEEHGKALASVRAGNVIGGGDWAKDRIIPDCIRALQNDIAIDIRNPKAVRPWQHVLEPLSGYMLLGALLYENPTAYAEGWNFGPENSSVVPVGEIADMVVEAFGSGSWQSNMDPNAPHEAKLLALDVSKAHFRLGWEPRWSVKEAITHTVNWYVANAGGTDMYDLCKQQIALFCKKED